MSRSEHDVFISFRGKKTGANFTPRLCRALSRKRIKNYLGSKRLRRGDEISSTALQRAIEDAKISLVVFSKNYAFSPRCLNQLMHILKCRKERGQIVIPIFRGVSPTDVGNQKGSYGDAFSAHETAFELDKVSEWRAALSEAANLAGWNSQDWKQSEVIEMIVDDVLKILTHVRRSFALDTKRNRFLRVILEVLSAIAGLIFLTQSSFKLLFDDSKTSELLLFGIVTALLIFLVSMAPNWGDVLRKIWNLSFSKKLTIEILFMGVVWMLTFLIKYPQFDIRSKEKDSCVLRNNERMSQQGSQYTLFSAGAFALLAVLLSFDRQQTLELGFFSILIGLIMDTSMEIPTSDDGPNVWYIPCSVVYCIGLILFKHYTESSPRNPVLPVLSTRDKRKSPRDTLKNIFVFFSALAGILCLFLSPFSKQQFEDFTDLKGACFITFSLLLGFSLWKARVFIDFLVKECQKHYLVKAIVRTLLFAFLSMIMFLTKYPRFKLHSELKESCKEQNGHELKSERNQFDVFSTASFSLFALIMSYGQELPVKLDISSFLLELTMDSSIEILGNDEPNFFCLVFSSVYCASLILVKSYLDSSVGSVLQHRSD